MHLADTMSACQVRYALFAQHAHFVCEALAARLPLRFEARDSSFWGPYERAICAGGQIMLLRNRDPMFRPGDPPHECFFDAAHPDRPLLLDVDGDGEPALHEALARALTAAGTAYDVA